MAVACLYSSRISLQASSMLLSFSYTFALNEDSQKQCGNVSDPPALKDKQQREHASSYPPQTITAPHQTVLSKHDINTLHQIQTQVPLPASFTKILARATSEALHPFPTQNLGRPTLTQASTTRRRAFPLNRNSSSPNTVHDSIPPPLFNAFRSCVEQLR